MRHPLEISTPVRVTIVNGWRYYTEAAPGLGLVIQAADDLEHRVEAVVESHAGLTAPLVLLVPLARVALFWTVSRSLSPIGAVSEAIRARDDSNLEPVPHIKMPEELAPIVQEINRLIERLARSLESERGVAANSAHELRIPVAAALAQAQRLEAELVGTSRQARIHQLVSTLR